MFSNGPSIIKTGLDLLIDAADKQSYPGSGTVWTDLRSGTTGSLTGSVTYTSEYYGGLTFTNSSSAVIFPGSTANYGTGSFTVEMAFKPDYIEGKHYLMSKNSGSFPNWAIYLSGSNGSGKLWSEFNIDASVSCSVSSSTTFETGSVYQVDVRVLPASSTLTIYVNGQSEGGDFGNGTGSLNTTASLFVGNFSQNNTQNFSGSIYTIKTYSTTGFTIPAINFNALATRLTKQPVPQGVLKVFELLVVAGGGGGGKGPGNNYTGGGGGAGGLQYVTNFNIPIGRSTVTVGAGGLGSVTPGGNGLNGENSSFASIISIGGGGGGGGAGTGAGNNGGSGGGGAGYTLTSTGSGILGQGFNGGKGAGTQGAGGGGGAGGPGSDWNQGRLGGPGLSYNMTGEIVTYAAGGNGGSSDSIAPTPIPNTGNGGNGNRSPNAGDGASGIVAIRYNGTPIALGGEITQSEGYTYHVFRTVGTSSFTIF